MSRAKGPRLHLKRYKSGERYWIIRDRAAELGTGCREGQLAEAERRLAAYIAEKYQPETRARALREVLIADVVNLYLNEVMPHVANPSFIAYTAEPVLEWWGPKTLADVRGRSCRDYVEPPSIADACDGSAWCGHERHARHAQATSRLEYQRPFRCP
jgi:hypothetical protein